MGFIGGFIKGAVFTGIGVMLGGPVGGMVGMGLAMASSNDKPKYKYSFDCPSCNASNGVDSYGRYNCYNCSTTLDVDVNGVRISGISVDCPNCDEELIIREEGLWICEYCKRELEVRGNYVYGHTKTLQYSFLGVLAKMAKAEGRVTSKHIQILDRILVEDLELSGNERKEAIEKFNEAKVDNRSFQEYCFIFKEAVERSYIEDKYGFYCGVLFNLYEVGLCFNIDGYTTREYLNCAIGTLGINKEDYYQIRSELTGIVDEKYYKILGCKSSDSFEVIRSNYRRLVKEYHPDKVNNMKVSEDIKDTLIDKFKDIQEAYELIKDTVE
ncbi:MAG: DnaJ domain-containing protein [Sarcina sp.]